MADGEDRLHLKWIWTQVKRRFSYMVENSQDNQVVVNLNASESLASSSEPRRPKYDVFLSFRGPDTRKGITFDIYDRLNTRGIKTFMDDRDLEVGDAISPTLVAAIKESRFAIVVLSQNYASSTWCLEELREICLSMEDNRILPLFYHVDPTEVRYQKKGSFKEAFSKHVKSGRYRSEKVKEWRAALYKVANISGWSTTDHKTERGLVEAIVDLLGSKVVPDAIESTGDFQAFEATRQAMDEVMKALTDDKVTYVGVHGMGGVGKTTMVKHVAAQACRDGSFNHWIMATISQNHDLIKVQDTLAELLGFTLQEKTEDGRAIRLHKEIMRKEKLLIIVDDVWERTELSKIGIPDYEELQTCNSKVLLTTRRLNVCHAMKCHKQISLKALSDQDSWTLFVRNARRSFESPTFVNVAKKVAGECKGLPIALITVARALGDKDLAEWEKAAQRLEKSQSANPDHVESVSTHTVDSEEFQETRQGMDDLMEVQTDDEVSAIGVYGTGGVGKTTMVIPSGSSSSSAVNWKYDVYLSFRGADTRKGFTSTLCDGLKKRGITTFMDADLQVGDPISITLIKAIEESRFVIVVLSPNYATSTCCLEELTKICKFMEDGLRILPVFYAVNSSDVRYQKGSFEDAFTKHERSGRYGSEKVQQWREALRKVGSLSGWLAQDYKTEIELIEAIVEFVCSKIYTAGFEVFEATRRAMDEVMKALKDEEVAAIGVYGVGGVGKTTMVEHVSAKVWCEGMFHHVINAVVSKSPDLRKMQGTLADMLGLELEEETDIGRSHRLMQKIRRGSRILIILDDIWENIDLSSIGIPGYHELQRSNSKVLLITRTQNVLCAMECRSNICLDVLSEKDSLTLFMNRARMSFESINSSDVAIKVARECAGLPIVLIAVAKALGGKDNWEEAARRLKASPPANPENGKVVFNCIKLSYDYLAYDDARSFFLLCCLFPEDYDIQIEDLLKYGMGKGLFQDSSTMLDARASAHSVVKYLIDCSLLLESERDGCVKMHDVIRDEAIRISSSEDGRLFVKAGCQLKEWPIISAPDGYSAISLIRNKICKLPEKLVCLKLLILFLQSNVCLDEIPENFFQSLNVLRVLDLSQTRLSLLPTSFNLLINLHTLYLDGCLSIIDNISILGKLQKLEILSMRDLPLLELPEEIGLLSNLRMLDITGEYVDIVPSEVIYKLHRLEELYMQCNFADWRSESGRTEVNWRKVDEAGEKNKAAFDELTSLSRLNILKVFISDANCLPKVVGVEPKWINFDICISENSSIRKVSLVSNSSPHYTRALTLGTTINALPVWFVNVVTAKAEKLQYLTCRGLDNILVEYDLGRLHALKYFSVIGPSENLKILMNTTTRVQNGPVFQNLEELHLVQVDCLKELCVGELSQGSLCNLRLLKVNCCYKLVDALLPSQLLQRLENLEELICEEIDELEYVFGCEGLKPEPVILTKLKEMRLENLGKLINIWTGPAPCTIFQNLHSLVVSGCFELENLFTADVGQCLLQLEDLSVESCPLLERVVEANKDTMDSEIVFPKLKNLALIKLPQLTRFYGNSESAIECPLLESLNVERCPQFSTSDFIAGIKSNICTLYEEGLVL